MTTFATRARRVSAVTAAIALGFTGALVAAPAANAATITVTSAADAGAGTLRQAVIDANSGAFPGVDTINFNFAIPASSITLASTIVVTEAINLDGPGNSALQIIRNGNFEMFEFDMAAADQDVAIDGLWFDGGLGTTERGLDFLDAFPVRNLTISDSEFAVFQTTARGGAVNIEQLTGNLIINNTDFHDNASTGNAQVGSFFAEDIDSGFISITGSNFEGNAGESGSGLEIMFSETADLIISDCTFVDNQSTNAGAGAFLYGLGSVTIRDSTFTNNDVSANTSGALYIQSILNSVSIENTTFSNSDSFSGNGGAASIVDSDGLEIIDSTFTNNTAINDGGALWLALTGETRIEGSTFTSNDSLNNGGAVSFASLDGGVDVERSVFDQNTAIWLGSAIHVADAVEDVTVDSSTFTGNFSNNASTVNISSVSQTDIFFTASTFSGNVVGGSGATSIGIGTIEVQGIVVIANSTFAEVTPTANGVVSIGAIDDDATQPGRLFIISSTLLGNGVLEIGSNDGFAIASHVIVNGNVNGAGDVFDVNGTNPVALEYSIVTTAFDASNMNSLAGNLFSTDPQLGALAFNGGPTRTMLPAVGSPAVDAGDVTYDFAADFLSDQRGAGFVRIFNGRVDIGAVELQTLALAATGVEVSPLIPLGAGGILILGAAALIFARRHTTGVVL